ncbi:MAG: hypothetical protein O2782_04120 [bacterium]|nr:hypothetical protein [bacterium]
MRTTLIIATLLATATAVLADDSTPIAVIGYVDADGDGRNDRFRDADGDGRNDVTQQTYTHHFPFDDADGDGRNDHFRDADGDGINDLDGRTLDADADGVCDNVLDADADGRNDITGVEVRDGLDGWRFGRIDEGAGMEVTRFMDRDGDGMHDLWADNGRRGAVDLFIDEDGDGIADGRALRGGMDALDGLGTLRLHGRRMPRDEMPRRGDDEDHGPRRGHGRGK